MAATGVLFFKFYFFIIFCLVCLIQKILQIIHYHNNSIAQALTDLFPEIGLEKQKLLCMNGYLCLFGVTIV